MTLAGFDMQTEDLRLYVAHDLINEVSDDHICTSWDISPDTLKRWKKDPQFELHMEVAKDHKKLHIPVLFPTELRNLMQ